MRLKTIIGLFGLCLMSIALLPSVRCVGYYSNTGDVLNTGGYVELRSGKTLSYFSDEKVAENVNSLNLHVKGSLYNCTCTPVDLGFIFNVNYLNYTVILNLYFITQSGEKRESYHKTELISITKSYVILTQSNFEGWVDILSVVREGCGKLSIVNSSNIISINQTYLDATKLPEGISSYMREAAGNHYSLLGISSSTGVALTFEIVEFKVTRNEDSSIIINVIIIGASSVSLFMGVRYKKRRGAK